jgi:hypothetical protein
MKMIQKKTLYIETSVVSYLTARPSANLLAAANQKMTIDWWEDHRSRFDLRISKLVLEEAGKGHPKAAARRLAALEEITVLDVTDKAVRLSKALLKDGALPAKALDDSVHVAVSTVHGIDFLLTWNCRHIDNAEMKPVIREICERSGHRCPEICTPQELMGVSKE